MRVWNKVVIPGSRPCRLRDCTHLCLSLGVWKRGSRVPGPRCRAGTWCGSVNSPHKVVAFVPSLGCVLGPAQGTSHLGLFLKTPTTPRIYHCSPNTPGHHPQDPYTHTHTHIHTHCTKTASSSHSVLPSLCLDTPGLLFSSPHPRGHLPHSSYDT